MDANFLIDSDLAIIKDIKEAIITVLHEIKGNNLNRRIFSAVT